MIRLIGLSAEPHPSGGRVDLRWTSPDPSYGRMRVVRRPDTHPASPTDGVVVTPGDAPAYTGTAAGRAYHVADQGLHPERVYYYAVFPYQTSPGTAGPLPENRAAAIATAPYGFADRMEALLPALYRRYDAAQPAPDPARVAPEDRGKGPLRRFLEVTGGELDRMQSLARTLLDAHDPDRVDGRLIPLLAEWIGWPTDYRLEVASQRTELRQAPYVYRTIGIIPTVEATVKRVLGWESRVKEFSHNVCRTNVPERLTLWARERGSAGTWSEPTDAVSLHEAYEGRPAAAYPRNGPGFVLFHSLRLGRWAIRAKTFDATTGAWGPSRVLAAGPDAYRHPAAVAQATQVTAFWERYRPSDRSWRLETSTWVEGGDWTAGAPVWNDGVPRRAPAAAVDSAGTLWLFWNENTTGRWRMRFARRTTPSGAFPAGRDFPLDGTADPRVEADAFVLAHPTLTSAPLWVFWARKRAGPAAGQTRWEIAYRSKGGLDPTANDWGPVRTLARPADADDREPAARVDATGRIELFWSSTRDRSWSVWRAVLDPGTNTWTTPEAITGNPFTERAPLPFSLGGNRTLLLYRANPSVEYASTVYGATRTLDARYAGCTAVDTRNAAKLARRGAFDDFGTYTCDTGRGERNWYARDTVGIYLTAGTEDPTVLARSRSLLERVLRQFLPAQVRPVFIIDPGAYQERAYTYEAPRQPQRLIGETAFDAALPETLAALAESGADRVPGWVWLRAWSSDVPGHRTVDLADLDLSRRTWHTGLGPGEEP